MNILIVYGTTEGQTCKIAEFLKAEAEKMRHKVFLWNAISKPVSLDGYDAVLIGSSMHMEKYQTSVADFIQRHNDVLNQIHSAFFSVSLTAATDDEMLWNGLKGTTNEFLANTGWKPAMVEYVAGALRFAEYDFFKKFIVRLIAKRTGHPQDASHDTEYTDWGKLQLFLKKFIDTWVPNPVTVQQDVSDQEACA